MPRKICEHSILYETVIEGADDKFLYFVCKCGFVETENKHKNIFTCPGCNGEKIHIPPKTCPEYDKWLQLTVRH